MRKMLELALQYGGFTTLDKAYLEQVLSHLTPEQQLAFITPPPSVLNAYFAEIYQKKSPQAATDYYFQLSKALQLFQVDPSFVEVKPFIRLNLSGQSYGFAYVNDSGLAQVFAEKPEEVQPGLLFELAQVFPHYLIFQENEKIWMCSLDLANQAWQEVKQERFLLTQIAESPDWVKISGLNQEEVLEAAASYTNQVYYAWSERQALIYIRK